MLNSKVVSINQQTNQATNQPTKQANKQSVLLHFNFSRCCKCGAALFSHIPREGMYTYRSALWETDHLPGPAIFNKSWAVLRICMQQAKKNQRLVSPL